MPSAMQSNVDYAVVETGGKQYTVHLGDTLKVERIASPQEGSLELDRVLLLSKDGQLKVGQPLVEGAKVMAEVIYQGRAPKVIVFKYKPKVRYRRKRGHRQPYTQLKVTEIVTGERSAPRRRAARPRKATSDGS